MNLQDDVSYRALTARDTRFDGVFFVGVKTTGIYCRPVCTAKTPRRESCRFFSNAALAEQAGFRPCLRCRPELAPGNAPIDSSRAIAKVAAERIEAGILNDGGNLDDLAASLGLSSRQLRRVVRKELGVSPIELAQTNRLLLAKRLIAETQLPLVQIAFASGFESVRRFNALFQSHYRLTPSELRRSRRQPASEDSLRLTLGYRPPYDWPALLQFLEARAIPGVECISDGVYRRTVALGQHRGWICVAPVVDRNLLAVDLARSLAPALPAILVRLRRLFDLDARPDVIAGHLKTDPLLGPSLAHHPGLRVPGAFDSFELAMRALLGQQVSVRAASTLAGRFAERFGEHVQTPFPCLNRITPAAASIAAARSTTIASLGLPGSRAESLLNLAQVISRGDILLEPTVFPETIVAELQQLPGIGPWTAQYIAMRAMRWPDAFPEQDLGLIRATSLKGSALTKAAERWRPWRAYAAMHLWEGVKGAGRTKPPAKNEKKPGLQVSRAASARR